MDGEIVMDARAEQGTLSAHESLWSLGVVAASVYAGGKCISDMKERRTPTSAIACCTMLLFPIASSAD